MESSNRQVLQANELERLRERGLIENDEYAYIAGDLLVAENVTTSAKRVLGATNEVLAEGTRRVLKG